MPHKEQVIPSERIEKSIFLIRGQKVMLDNDLAELYDVPTKVFNQAVKRNKSRFPSDFMFQLTKFDNLRSQIVTLETGRGRHRKYLRYRSGRPSFRRFENSRNVEVSRMRLFTLRAQTHVAISPNSLRSDTSRLTVTPYACPYPFASPLTLKNRPCQIPVKSLNCPQFQPT